MKTLLLMRHAKSSWKDSKLDDFDRPLNSRGKKDAPMMGRFLLSVDLVPELILSSSAKRALKTAEAVIESTGFTGEFEHSRHLYMADCSTLLQALREVDNHYKRILLISHNPGLEGLLHYLSREVEAMPTAAIAHIALPIKKWQNLKTNTLGHLINLWKPRNLK